MKAKLVKESLNEFEEIQRSPDTHRLKEFMLTSIKPGLPWIRQKEAIVDFCKENQILGFVNWPRLFARYIKLHKGGYFSGKSKYLGWEGAVDWFMNQIWSSNYDLHKD